MRKIQKTNGPRKVQGIFFFINEKFKKMSGILRKQPLSLHRKTAKLLYMALV